MKSIRCQLPAAGANDMDWVAFAVENEIDLLAVSFVRRAADLAPINDRIAALGADIPLIAKIEKPQALEHAEEILEQAVSGIMVARGDLGIEVPIESMPPMQKRLIALAGSRSKPVITATQMLASMVHSARPTRAEVTDVANAIYDGSDAVMLSEETVRRLNLLFGVRCYLHARGAGLSALLEDAASIARELGVADQGDLIAITAALPEQRLGTNLVEIHRV